ncbi:MAG: peptidoglycan-binding domain-containing protein [Alsobacter sp.]
MLARSDHDFVLNDAKPRRRKGKPPTRAALLLRTAFRNPGRTVVGAASAAFAVAIAINAMVMQGGPHPAPFFRPPVDVLRPAQAPVPPSRPADLIAREIAVTDAVPAPAGQSSSAPAAKTALPKPPAPAVPVPAPRDPIADVLKAAPAAPEPSRTALFAQRALAKLNYGPIKPDGLLGPGTRAAIERFERDHKLPVTGELAPRTLKELAAASGLPQE